MRISYKLIRIFGLLPILFILGCEKNVPGPKGDPGTNGKMGNSDQTSTPSIFIPASAWGTVQTTSGSVEWQTTKFVEEISKTAIQSGEVRVFISHENSWWALPFAEGDLFTQYSVKEKQLKLYFQDIHGGIPPQPEDHNFRILVVTPKQ